MKTFKIFDTTINTLLLPIVLGFLVISCGSYQNNSYYDNDGIYSSPRSESVSVDEQKTVQTGSYFTQFQEYELREEEPVGIFTDVDSYYGGENSYSDSYAGWGNNTSNVTVNVYGGYGWNDWYGGGYWGWRNPYWGWGWNSWYGPSWGWNWGWGSWYGGYWGWNHGWGGYYPYHGGWYNNNVAYVRGPRNGYYSDYGYRSRVSSNASRSNVSRQSRAYEVRGRSQNTTPTRSDSRFTTNSARSNNVSGSTRNTGAIRSTAPVNNGNRNTTINNGRNTTINNGRSSSNNSSRNSTINNSTRNGGNNSSMGRGSSNMGGSRSSGTSGGGGGRSSSGGGRR